MVPLKCGASSDYANAVLHPRLLFSFCAIKIAGRSTLMAKLDICAELNGVGDPTQPSFGAHHFREPGIPSPDLG